MERDAYRRRHYPTCNPWNDVLKASGKVHRRDMKRSEYAVQMWCAEHAPRSHTKSWACAQERFTLRGPCKPGVANEAGGPRDMPGGRSSAARVVCVPPCAHTHFSCRGESGTQKV